MQVYRRVRFPELVGELHGLAGGYPRALLALPQQRQRRGDAPPDPVLVPCSRCLPSLQASAYSSGCSPGHSFCVSLLGVSLLSLKERRAGTSASRRVSLGPRTRSRVHHVMKSRPASSARLTASRGRRFGRGAGGIRWTRPPLWMRHVPPAQAGRAWEASDGGHGCRPSSHRRPAGRAERPPDAGPPTGLPQGPAGAGRAAGSAPGPPAPPRRAG